MTPAVLYRRVSSLRQSDEGQSLDDQDRELRAYCAMQRWEIIGNFEDAISGTRKNAEKRVGLETAVALACEHKAALVVYDLDRLARSQTFGMRMVERLQDAGAHLVIKSLGIDTTTPTGELMLGIMFALAQWGSRNIGAAVSRANRGSIARVGYRTQGRQPFGWKWDDRARERVPDPLAQSTLAFIHDARKGREPLSYAAIASQLNELMRPAPKGGLWHQRSVQRVHLAALKLWRRTAT